MGTETKPPSETAVLHVGGLHYAGEKSVLEQVLGRRPGVLAVEANPVAQTATVTLDPALISVEDLQRWVRDCGYHCAGQSVPGHVCDPMAEHGVPAAPYDHAATERPSTRTATATAATPGCPWTRWRGTCATASWSRSSSPSPSSPGRWSAPACSGPS